MNKIPLIAAGLASSALGLAGCATQDDQGLSVSGKSQAVLLLPRQHHEVIDPQDGLFVTYWERYYDQGMATMDLTPNGYTSNVDYTAVVPLDTDGDGDLDEPNNVTGKGKHHCWGDVLDWTVTSSTNVHSMRVYGWHEAPLVEYYIGRGFQGGRTVTGEYTTSRGRYKLHIRTMDQENILNPTGDPLLPRKFLQFNVESLDPAGADSGVGPVNLTEHFAGWETLMAAWWPLQADWIAAGWSWNPLTKANYCVVATELYGRDTGSATITNISVTETACQIVDGSCNGDDSDCDGSIDEDYPEKSCTLPSGHATCPGQPGMTSCSGGAESCVPNVAGTEDRCDGIDNDCDGTTDEDPIPEEVCNGVDDDCDGVTDEGSINLPIRCVHDADEDGIEDGLDTQPATYSDEFAEDDFGSTTGEIVDRGEQTVVVLDPLSEEGVWIETLPGGGAIEAEISLCGGTVTITMGPGENQVVTCPAQTCLFANQELKLLDRAQVWSDFYAGSFILQYDAKVYANGLSPGNGNLFDRARITGTATLGGTLTGNEAGVGTLLENQAVAAQALLEFPIVVSGTNLSVPPNTTAAPLAPGDYGDVVVGHDSTLILNAAGTYRFNSLELGPDTNLNVTAAAAGLVVIAVEGNLTLGDRLEVFGNAELDIYANGTSVVVGYDVHLNADIKAPFAFLDVKDRVVYNGCLGGKNVRLGYDVQMTGVSAGPGPGPSPPVLNAWLTKTNDWGGDYCVNIGVSNTGGMATGWRVTVNTNGSTIYNRWNGTFSGTWGTVNAVPNQSYNLTLDPGETDTSVGFCVHRNAPGQNATLVSIVPN